MLAVLCGSLLSTAATVQAQMSCERGLQSDPPKGPGGTVVELTGLCYWIHSGGQAPIYFDDQVIGAVSGETGGDFQNLLRIPANAAVGRHQLRFAGTLMQSVATYEMTPARQCVGDCDNDDHIGVAELITGVNIALQRRPLAVCAAFDFDSDGAVGITELIAAIQGDLNGCHAAPELSAFEGDYEVAIGDAGDYTPGAAVVGAGSVGLRTAESAPALELQLPYAGGVVSVGAALTANGILILHGMFNREGDHITGAVSGKATAVADGNDRWITGTLSVHAFGRDADLYFVMSRPER